MPRRSSSAIATQSSVACLPPPSKALLSELCGRHRGRPNMNAYAESARSAASYWITSLSSSSARSTFADSSRRRCALRASDRGARRGQGRRSAPRGRAPPPLLASSVIRRRNEHFATTDRPRDVDARGTAEMHGRGLELQDRAAQRRSPRPPHTGQERRPTGRR